jgi:hypothetical protein
VTQVQESARALRMRAQLLVTLPRVEAFRVLIEEIEKKQTRIERTLMSLVLTDGMDGEKMQRQADHDRGFIAGMRYATIEIPQGAERMLARTDVVIEEEGVADHWSYDDAG